MDGNVGIEDLEQHLLFYKALSEDEESLGKIDGYMEILSRAETGERLTDPVDEAIRAVFSLVLENGIDPWAIDLSEFVRVYSAKVDDGSFDMIVAGKLILMAWKILRLQSESTVARSEPPVYDEFDDTVDFGYEDDPLPILEVPFREAYVREPVRPVTMIELIDAFEDARKEIEIQRERERVRAELKAKEPKKFDNKAHDEDDERDVEAVWQRIASFGKPRIRMTDLYTGDMMANLTTFISVLHLVRDGRLDVSQEELPSGTIYIDMVTSEIRVDDVSVLEAAA